jgi:hypothetical protein
MADTNYDADIEDNLPPRPLCVSNVQICRDPKCRKVLGRSYSHGCQGLCNGAKQRVWAKGYCTDCLRARQLFGGTEKKLGTLVGV